MRATFSTLYTFERQTFEGREWQCFEAAGANPSRDSMPAASAALNTAPHAR